MIVFLKVNVWSYSPHVRQLVHFVPQKLINVPWTIRKNVCVDSALLSGLCFYPVLLRNVIPMVQLLDIDDGWNQKAGVHLPFVRLS